MSPRSLSITTLVLFAACGRDSAAPNGVRADAAKPTSPATKTAAEAQTTARKAVPQLPRSTDARFVAALEAFGRGDLAGATQLRTAVPDELDFVLLGARISAVSGDEIGAVRAIEAMRARHPDQARVYATAAEIHAAAGRISSAEDEIREGLSHAGPSPDLTRARGVLALCREGGARKGLEHLLAAVAEDPELPYCSLPLAQAHLLLGNAALADKNLVDAVGHARAALKACPDESDATQLLADACAAGGDYERALELYERLLARGLDVRGTLASLCLRAATASLVQPEARDVAIERYLRARELGLSAEELGFGATVLENEARRRTDLGLAAFEASSFDVAREHLDFARRCTPESVEVLHLSGVVAFKQARFEDAVASWTDVLTFARRDHLELPDPVHLNLARALYKAGRAGEVRAVLERYLSDAPEGEFVAETREMLARLQKDAAAGSTKSN